MTRLILYAIAALIILESLLLLGMYGLSRMEPPVKHYDVTIHHKIEVK